MTIGTLSFKLLKVAEAFETVNTESVVVGTCGNIQYELFKDSSGTSAFYDEVISKVSAPYALSRLIALFSGLQVSCYGQEAYKVTWTAALRHKKTGTIVTFYDWKGGFSVGSNLIDKCPVALKRDLVKLLYVLTNDRCPHPYDGCVVGEIA